MLLGLLLTYGIQPGPSIVTEHLDLMYLIVWSFAIASVLGALLCFAATPMLAKLTKVPFSVLGAGLLVIMFLGAYQEGGQLGDLWVMLILGVVGWVMKESGVPRAPFLIGFVLAIPMERYYYLTASLYDGFSWITRPGVIVFLAILVGPILWQVFKFLRNRNKISHADEGHRHEETSDDEDTEMPLRDTAWSVAAAIGFLVVFIGAAIASTQFSPEARLMPQLITFGGIGISAALLAVEIRTRVKGGNRLVSAAVKRPAFTAFAWMAGFLILAGLLGYLAALLLIVPAFLMVIARAKLRTVLIYTAVLAVAVAVLPSLLPVDLPTGLLG